MAEEEKTQNVSKVATDLEAHCTHLDKTRGVPEGLGHMLTPHPKESRQ